MNILYFFIGTEAELMKMFKVISLARKEGVECRIISNGQNIIKDSPFLPLSGGQIDIDLSSNTSLSKNSTGYLKWFLKTRSEGIQTLKHELELHKKDNCLLVVHGDTLSTLMGAMIAKKCKMDYVHVESGLRSYHWFSPFPEEFDRYYASLNSKINFCPKDNYTEYASRHFKGKAVNTVYNTGIETLYYALEKNKQNNLSRIIQEPYFVLAIHRQENLLSKQFMEDMVAGILELSKKIKCLFIYHVQTYDALCKYGLWDKIIGNKNIIIIKRLPYCEFIHAINDSEFVVADGCGNQQEFYYLGKPYLIMRTRVEENSEGLGWNAEYFKNDFSEICKFYDKYEKYIHPQIKPEILPSEIIVNEVKKYFKDIAKG